MKHLKVNLMLIAMLAFSIMSVSCNEQKPPVDNPENNNLEDTSKVVEPVGDLEPFVLSVPVTDDWIFSGKPEITIHIENPNKVAVTAEIKVKISTDTKKEVTTIEKKEEIAANAKTDIVITTEENLAPGFYKATCAVNKKIAMAGAKKYQTFCFGIDPFDIESAPDKQSDYDKFWDDAKAQLAAVEMNATLTEITKKSSSTRKVYLVEMQSVPDGLTGEPVTIRGYYCEPQDDAKHPVIMHFYGYDSQNTKSKVECPSGGSSQYAEFYLSHRGQYLNNRPASSREPDGKGDFENIYGDWFAYHFGDKDSYYYRGAFMDCVQAVNFMASRSTSDMSNLFAEGSSQGGALSYAAAALSDYPFTAIAPNVAFLGDFPDYFKIVSWPAETAKANKGSMSDEEMYKFLSYFDTKNLATRISCAVLATSGLQDGTCPPHTNIAPYNNLKSTDKEYHFYPEMQHDYPANWSSMIMTFFKERIK